MVIIMNSIKVTSLTCKLLFLSGKENGLVPDQAWWQILCVVKRLWSPSSPRCFFFLVVFPRLQCQTVFLQMTRCHPVELRRKWKNTFLIPCHHERSFHKPYSRRSCSHPRVNPKRAKSKTVTREGAAFYKDPYKWLQFLKEIPVTIFFFFIGTCLL